MKIIYYNLKNEPENSFAKKYGNYRKKILITFQPKNQKYIEYIQLENSDRGHLLWVVTPNTVRVFGFWKNESRGFFGKWRNDHCGCC